MQEPHNSTHPELLRLNRERIEVAYLDGVRKGYDDTAVLLLDPDDATARTILEAMGVLSNVDAVAADKTKQDVKTYATIFVTADWAGRYFKDLGFPDVQPSLASLLGHQFGLIIAADGAVSVVGLPKPTS